MEITALQFIWFILLFVLLGGYAMLDGFDLGIGVWHLWARAEDRRSLLDAIRPVWDGNEVWLLTAGGAMFAAFPPVYASVFSGLYLALTLLLVGLIARASAVEFRDKHEAPSWRRFWDVCFAAGSVVPALLLGVAMGNILRGLPLDASGNFTGSFFSLLNPYALLCGLLGLAVIAAHGALYAALRTPGPLAIRARRWARLALQAALLLFGLAAAVTILTQRHLLTNYDRLPVLWAVPLATALALSGAAAYNRRDKARPAFAASCAGVLGLLATAAVGLFPTLVPASNNAALSLTAANSSSSELTLRIMFIFALVGMPIVIGYNVWAYRLWATQQKGTSRDY